MPPGGTFIFATWEHESIFNSPAAGAEPAQTHLLLFELFCRAAAEGAAQGFYPPLDQTAYPVVRQYPVLANTKAVTAAFHSAIKAQNAKSHWLNYHLVGTQFQAVNLRKPVRQGPPFPISANDPTGIGQPVFLSNLRSRQTSDCSSSRASRR